jgi:peptidylprolyl isomerase
MKLPGTLVTLTLMTLGISGCEVPEESYANLPPVSGEARVAFAQRVIEIAEGTGAPAQPRQCYFVHYTGWLTDGSKFDSSRDTLQSGETRPPISFPQGARRVIVGWDLGFEGMRVGSKRRLIIPYQLAYGERGRPPIIPPKSDLVFDVELMAVTDTLPSDPNAPAPAERRQPPAPGCPEWDEVRGAS